MLRLFEVFTFMLFSYFWVSQIIVPIWRGTPAFPWFRKPGDVQHRLAEVREEQEVADLEEQIERSIVELKKHGCEVSHDLSEIRCTHASHKGEE